MKHTSLFTLALATLAGCALDLTPATEVIEPRLMGMRVEVEGEPTRPRPRLGERFALRQFLSLPGPLTTPLETRYSMQLALCLGVKTAFGTLVCLGEQQISPRVTPVNELELLLDGFALDLDMIDLSTLDLPPGLFDSDAGTPSALASEFDFDRITLVGALCVDGRAERIPGRTVAADKVSQLYRCVDNQGAKFPDPSPFTLSVLLDRGSPADANKNPLFACDPAAPTSACSRGVTREGEPLVPGTFVLARPKVDGQSQREVAAWPPIVNNLALPWQGCASDPNLLQVRVDSGEHTIRMRFDPSDREPFIEQIKINNVPTQRARREALALTSAATTEGGELGRFDSLLANDEDDALAEVSVSYTPPDSNGKGEHLVPENGRLVRFYFTVRDQRGGVDYAVRELCLVPAVNQE